MFMMWTTGKEITNLCAEMQGNWRNYTVHSTQTHTSRNNTWNFTNISNKIEYMTEDSKPKLF
jgi:spermidine synthase